MCHASLIIDLIEAHAVFRLDCRYSTHSMCNACSSRESAIYIYICLFLPPPPFFFSFFFFFFLVHTYNTNMVFSHLGNPMPEPG